jgi:hypothetical protein
MNPTIGMEHGIGFTTFQGSLSSTLNECVNIEVIVYLKNEES